MNKPTDKKIEVPESFYNELYDAYLKLLALEELGVDNWEGHEMAMSRYEELKNEEG